MLLSVDVGGIPETLSNWGQARRNSLGGLPEKERVAAALLGASASACYGLPVEDARRSGHLTKSINTASALQSGVARNGRRLLDLLFPPLCIQCRGQISEAGNLCAKCWSAIRFIDGPSCVLCGLPFEIPTIGETRCGACHAEPPAFDRARAVMRYEDASKGMILALKHADRLDLVPGFARWLERIGRELVSSADAIVPVPLHRGRFWSRRYNQAAELARGLSRISGKKFEPTLLVRTRFTESQGEMPSASARRRNVSGAFAVPATARPRLEGRNILLIDDVLTTGATVDACARVLKRAGASKVSVLALARVSRTS
jgi:ComF family protein